MENASKAVLIAGAILLVLAVIGIGMAVFSTANRTIDNMDNSIDGLAVTAHNGQFNNYVGEKIAGTQVLECIQKALSIRNNAELETKFKDITVTVKYKTSTGTETETVVGTNGTNKSTRIKTNRYYSSVATYSTLGLIKSIAFTELAN